MRGRARSLLSRELPTSRPAALRARSEDTPSAGTNSLSAAAASEHDAVMPTRFTGPLPVDPPRDPNDPEEPLATQSSHYCNLTRRRPNSVK
jgi:hypothetical protein